MIDLNQIFDANERNQVAHVYANAGNHRMAASLFESILDVKPNDIFALCNTAHAAMKAKNMRKAMYMSGHAVSVAPDYAEAHNVRAVVLQENMRTEDADAEFRRALELAPKNPQVHMNYAYFLTWWKADFESAKEHFTIARDLNPLDLNVRFNRALCLMTQAESPRDWEEALSEYEIRMLLANTIPQGIQGQMLTRDTAVKSGSKLLMLAEQGVGDAVMMGRWARAYKRSNAFIEIHVHCREGMQSIMSRIEGVDSAFTDLASGPKCDYFLPMMSAMHVTDFPNCLAMWDKSPYLKRIHSARASGGIMRIGLCNAGNPAHGNDRFRSINYDLLWSLARNKNLDYVDVSAGKDLDDVQAKIESCDLVVTCDTGQLHIAGALGIPTFALIARCPDFRWGLNTEENRWYPSVHLFRAQAPLEWEPVIERVAKDIDQFVENRQCVSAA